MNFIKIRMADPLTNLDEANDVFVRPSMIIQIESYSGPFAIQQCGPDGRYVPNGQHKQVLNGSLVVLSGQGGRVCYDTPKEILAKITEHEERERFS